MFASRAREVYTSCDFIKYHNIYFLHSLCIVWFCSASTSMPSQKHSTQISFKKAFGIICEKKVEANWSRDSV